MTAFERYTPLLARFLLAAIFLLSGWGKVTDFGGTLGYMEAYGMPFASMFLLGAIALELGGGLLLLTGFKARLGALALIVFTVPATLIFHNFWALEGAEQYMQQLMFMKNLAILGGLVMVARFGAGPVALGRSPVTA